MLDKIQDSVSEFNEIQLVVFKTTLEKAFMGEKAKFEGQPNPATLMFGGDVSFLSAVESTYKEIQLELSQLHKEKALILAEEKIR